MLPTIEEAERELQIAGELNPGPWVKHSLNVGIAARNIAEKIPTLDENKAYILGILHDIGRRVGIVNIPKHVYEGYRFCMEQGWEEPAKICMTHSYVLMQEEFTYEPSTVEEIEIKKFIMDCQADDYDRLIQLCDALATDYGFVIIEKRFVDVTRRYGIMEGYVKGWNRTFEIKENFEKVMGCSVYDVLPDIGKTTLLSPPPWTPPKKISTPDKMRNLLSLEYNCKPSDFLQKQNILTVSKLHEGRRVYSSEKYFFHMATTGGNAVITADECLHPFLQEFMKERIGHWLFEIPNLLSLEKELHGFGYTLTQTHHMFLPDKDVTSQKDYPVKWFYEEEIHPFYGDERFPNAICSEYTKTRPDRMVVCAYDGDKIMGMAGCSEDAPGWQQIGIDVMPEYRSRGVGIYLVTLLKNKIVEQGAIPFYGTSVSNYHSWNIALNAGFKPAWVEIGAKRISSCS